ncbi:MAG: phosphodiester glycosidase family protein [Bacteroidales bacterium]|nr:phosphodiester glycosidase family protein [Bacteroidales bacterium]
MNVLCHILIALLPLFAAVKPSASQDAVVVCENARFTVLTPQLIRMEWAEDGVFEDRATLGVVNRDLPVPSFKVKKIRGGVRIKTSSVTLEYKGGKFGSDNLSVSFLMNGKRVLWRPGMDDIGNLMGTTRTLDRYDGYFAQEPDGRLTRDVFDKGVVSRDGWAIVDESQRHIFTEDGWVAERPEGDRQDWYIFAYGHDYLSAVRDYIKIGGEIPLPPKWAFGYWWSRYWLYNDFELEDVVGKLRGYGIPADVFVIDMDWHETWGLTSKNPALDDAGQSKGWTGYTWNKSLFPSPENTFEYLHLNGFKTSLNLHPASGIQTFEECYESFVKDYSERTGEHWPDGQYVPYRMSQREWAQSYFHTVLHPLESQGVDFWWLDWQQWPLSRYLQGLSNTFWLNHTFFEDSGRDGRRPMIYHRWGGLGSHRYQVGFSGDTKVSWKVLSYMPWFISTSSNVGYAYWGQDIGGHNEIPGINYTDAELFTRWVQEGVFTPIFKTHPTRNMNLERRIWMFPEQFDILKEAFRLRYSLSPYIYTAARQTYETGIGICRPLYYYWPEADEAYSFKEEYMFGDDILSAAICRPIDPSTGLAAREVWFPSGSDWFDMATGTMFSGGTVMNLAYMLAENPWYVRSSALIPMASPSIQSLQEVSDELYILAVPGEDDFHTRLYEDGGENADYDIAYSFTSLSREKTDTGVRVTVGAREGQYEGALEQRRIRLVLPGFCAPDKVLVNGIELPYSRFARDGVWCYDGASLSVTVFAFPTSADSETVIECEGNYAFVSGESGRLKRARIEAESVKNSQNAVDKYKWPDDAMMQWIGAASRITEDPWNAETVLQSLPEYPFEKPAETDSTFSSCILGNGLRLLEKEGIHILEIAPDGDYSIGFGYSAESKTVEEYGTENGLTAVSTATFGLPHTYVRINGKNISEISISPDNSRWWMHEAALMIKEDGTLDFACFDGMADRAAISYRNSKVKNIFSSAPMLIYEGAQLRWKEDTRNKHGFIYKQYPRTALAQLWDGTMLLLASDKAMSLPELQQLLTDSFFVRNAINLDGSAALYLEGEGNICSPSTQRSLQTFIEVRKK